MKIGGGLLFLGLLVVTFYRWYGEEERIRQANRRQRTANLETALPDWRRHPHEQRV